MRTFAIEMTNEEFIQLHLHDDVRTLALKKTPEDVDVVWCLQQIEGRQLAEKKLPRWAKTEGLWFPPRISMEQCSSELTAEYKRQQVERLLNEDERQEMADFTGGFGIDFSYMAQAFKLATYVERQAHLCDIAQHNLPLLGLGSARILNVDCTETLAEKQAPWDHPLDLIFMDPARRDSQGKKTVLLEDCTPNVLELKQYLYGLARVTLLKLSPMLDIAQALRHLDKATEVHVVSVGGECKELLIVLDNQTDGQQGVAYHTANLGTCDKPFVCTESEKHGTLNIATLNHEEEFYLHEPNASILKAGVQDALCSRMGVAKLHPMSHLFVSRQPLPDFPGRSFRIEGWSDFSKKGLRTLIGDLKQANLTIRNFPTSVADLRKKLKLREGGSTYLFATTLQDGSHALIRCTKI